MKHNYNIKKEALILVYDTSNTTFKCCFCSKRLKILRIKNGGVKETYCKYCDIWWEVKPS
jgi:hypothetical protein